MKKISFKIIILTLGILLVGIFLARPSQAQSQIRSRTEKAQVLELGPTQQVAQDQEEYRQELRVKILSGPKKGQVYKLINTLGDNPAYNINLEPGDKLTVVREENRLTGQEELYIADYYRLGSLKALLAVFSILLVLIGGWQGLRALLSLGLSIILIGYQLLPALLAGKSPLGVTIFLAFVITILSILIITGFTRKSLAAIVGTCLGVLVAGLVGFLLGGRARLTGLSADDATMLLYIPQGIEFRLDELLFSGIILGSLGAVMDVGMSIASAIEEIYQANKNLSGLELFSSGMNMGRDIMGTMVNTLILAYTGSSLPILLLFLAYDGTMLEIMNLDMVATEIVRSLAGSTGLILTIPLTSFVASLLIDRSRKEEDYESNQENNL